MRVPVTESGKAPRPGRRDFASLVRLAPAASVSLPLTHVTDAYMFRDIMGREELVPAPCDVFGGELVYLFYGRPAYRSAAELESNGLDAYWPICFVMEPQQLTPKRIYPFDSGAFHHKRFGDFMYHRMIKEDFELDSNPDGPGRLLRLFWKDEKSYFDNRGFSEFVPSTMDFEAKSYVELLRSRGRQAFDERNSAIEIQLDTPMALKGNTLAVILPYEFATVPMLAKIEAMGALALPYNVIPRHQAADMVGQIYTIVRDLFDGKYVRGKCW